MLTRHDRSVERRAPLSASLAHVDALADMLLAVEDLLAALLLYDEHRAAAGMRWGRGGNAAGTR